MGIKLARLASVPTSDRINREEVPRKALIATLCLAALAAILKSETSVAWEADVDVAVNIKVVYAMKALRGFI